MVNGLNAYYRNRHFLNSKRGLLWGEDVIVLAIKKGGGYEEGKKSNDNQCQDLYTEHLNLALHCLQLLPQLIIWGH